jgi:hypothetical protein
MKIEAYVVCIKKAVMTFIKYLITAAVMLFLTLLPVKICYDIYGIQGFCIGLLISFLALILVALIDHDITEYKRNLK